MIIDLNCDLGELPEDLESGRQEALMGCITSANIACGGHAGDERSMRLTVEQALRAGVAVGAHPGYEDPANFGRVAVPMSGPAIADLVERQVRVLAGVAAACGASLRHVKPHGALYNQAARDAAVADAVAEGIARVSASLVAVGLAGSVMLERFRARGLPAAAEAFADRAYESGGSLRPRHLPGAVLTDPEAAAEQALQLASRAQSLCVHSDSPGALEILTAVGRKLREAGYCLKAL